MSFYEAVEVAISDAMASVPYWIVRLLAGLYQPGGKAAGSGKTFFLKANRASFISIR